MSERKYLTTIISDFRAVHGERYGYDEVFYTNGKTKVTITCPDHGSFEQSPNKHRLGQGCPTCANARRNQWKRLTKEQFVDRCNEVHGGVYDYRYVLIGNTSHSVPIICPDHGMFIQSVEKHLLGQKCPECARILRGRSQLKPESDFICDAKQIHNDLYEYEHVSYEGAHKKVQITCKKHGPFWQTPRNHLNGNGCPTCKLSYRQSKVASSWLDSLQIDITREYRLPEKPQLIVDGFSHETRTVYLFHGDYWHGNPEKYPAHSINAHNKTSFGDLFRRTKKIEAEIVNLGYGLVTMWEKDWRLALGHSFPGGGDAID